jgi:N-acetylglutamate synthase-like GNAT family acetyltransferase
MQAIKFENYQNHHKDQIIPMILKIQTEEFSVPVTIDDQPDLLNIPSFYVKGNGNFWVATENDNVIGTIALCDIGNFQCALRKMFVAQEYRGKEKMVAHQLLAALLDWCKEKNVSDVYLGTVATFYAAHRFYEKNGFKEIEKHMLPTSFPVMAQDSKFYVYNL